MKYLYTNQIGIFVLDEKFNIIDNLLLEDTTQDIGKLESEIKNKYSDLKELPKEKLPQALLSLKKKEFYEKFYQINLELTKKGIKESVNEDQLIIQTIANIGELNRISNLLTKRLREWYSLYFPELSHLTSSNEKYAELISSKSKDELMKELKTKTMGADLKEADILQIETLAKEINHLYKLKEDHESYLNNIMKKYCPNVLELAGVTIGAQLLELAKSLRRMAFLPASTIQLLGAEKALFRHLKTGSRSPKYGVIFQHPLIQNTKRSKRGKKARQLADKLSICAKLDFFKGEFLAKEYRKELEEN